MFDASLMTGKCSTWLKEANSSFVAARLVGMTKLSWHSSQNPHFCRKRRGRMGHPFMDASLSFWILMRLARPFLMLPGPGRWCLVELRSSGFDRSCALAPSVSRLAGYRGAREIRGVHDRARRFHLPCSSFRGRIGKKDEAAAATAGRAFHFAQVSVRAGARGS